MKVKTITLQYIQDAIDHVKEFAYQDQERAHYCEDRLYREVLTFIASGECKKPKEFASE